MPKDDAHRQPHDDEPLSPVIRQVMADPTFRRCVIEILLASADELGLSEPLGCEGVATVQADPAFRERLAALTLATLEGLEAGA